MKLSISIVCMSVALAAAGCKDKGKAKDTPQAPPTPGTTAPGTTTPGTTAPGTTAPGANTPHTTTHPSRATTAVVEGAACSGTNRPVTDVTPELTGASLSFKRDRGGGCPTRAVYTAMYVKANPMQVRLCEDPGADTCEMMIMAEQVTIDLTAALAASGATSAVLAK